MSGEARKWWREVPTLVAVIGLLVTLMFNTAGVWLQLGQSEQAREDTALGLLTQLNGLARQAEAQLTGVRAANCKGDDLKRTDRAALIEAAQYYDYLAWLFNAKHIDMAAARRFWAPSMIETYELVTLRADRVERKRFANLRRFKFDTPEKQWPPPPGSDCER